MRRLLVLLPTIRIMTHVQRGGSFDQRTVRIRAENAAAAIGAGRGAAPLRVVGVLIAQHLPRSLIQELFGHTRHHDIGRDNHP